MNFMKFKWLYFLISGLVIVPGLISLFWWGLKPAVDFTGGTLWELKINPPAGGEKPTEELQALVESLGVKVDSLQTTGEKTYQFRLQSIEKNKVEEIKKTLGEKYGQIEEIRLETVGPILGKELLAKTIMAVILAAGFILLYVWRQFKEPMFGISAILAMFHDSLVILGIFSLLGHFKGVEVDALFVTAVLTILSFSVHDTVVVYDRIREAQKKFPNVPFVNLVNKAVTETLPRSINNSMTIIFMLISLYLLGGVTTKWFVFCLLIGTISGTYSSTFTAAPLLVVWKNWQERKKH